MKKMVKKLKECLLSAKPEFLQYLSKFIFHLSVSQDNISEIDDILFKLLDNGGDSDDNNGNADNQPSKILSSQVSFFIFYVLFFIIFFEIFRNSTCSLFFVCCHFWRVCYCLLNKMVCVWCLMNRNEIYGGRPVKWMLCHSLRKWIKLGWGSLRLEVPVINFFAIFVCYLAYFTKLHFHYFFLVMRYAVIWFQIFSLVCIICGLGHQTFFLICAVCVSKQHEFDSSLLAKVNVSNWNLAVFWRLMLTYLFASGSLPNESHLNSL